MTTKTTRRSQTRPAPVPPAPPAVAVPAVQEPALALSPPSLSALADRIAGLNDQMDAVELALANAQKLAWGDCRPSVQRTDAERDAERRYGVPALQEELNRLMSLRAPLIQRLALTAATDMTGLRAKLRLLARLLQPSLKYPGGGGLTADLTLSALADSERLAVA